MDTERIVEILTKDQSERVAKREALDTQINDLEKKIQALKEERKHVSSKFRVSLAVFLLVEAGLSKAEVARRFNVSPTRISQLYKVEERRRRHPLYRERLPSDLRELLDSLK